MSIETQERSQSSRFSVIHTIEEPHCMQWHQLLSIERTAACSPLASIEFNDKLYIFYTKESHDQPLSLGYIVLSTQLDGHAIFIESRNNIAVQGLTRARQAVSVFNGSLYCFFTANDLSVRYLTFNGDQWSSVRVVPDLLTSDAPAVFNNGDTLYLAVRGSESTTLFHKELWRDRWGDTLEANSIELKGSPSLCAYQPHPGSAKLYAGFRGVDDKLYISSLLHNQWSPAYTNLAIDLHDSVSIFAGRKGLYHATLKSPSHACLVGVHPFSSTEPVMLNESVETYVSTPCFVPYRNQLYLIGQRPCNNIGLSIFNGSCHSGHEQLPDFPLPVPE